MRRHEVDLLSLVAGVLFVGIAAAYLLGALTEVDVDGRWVVPVALIVLGIGGVLASLARLGRTRGAAGQIEEPDDPDR